MKFKDLSGDVLPLLFLLIINGACSCYGQDENQKTSSLPQQSTKIYQKKCHEYQVAVYNSSTEKCSIDTLQQLNDTSNVKPGQFPHMAVIGFKYDNGTARLDCMGSIISKNFILTAANCFSNGVVKFVRIDMTTANLQNKDEGGFYIAVEKVFEHPEYSREPQQHDIGLIKLARDIDFDTHKHPACLPSSNLWKQSKVIETFYKVPISDPIVYFQQRTVKIVTEEECSKIYTELTNTNYSYTSKVCANYKTHYDNWFQIDAGGPLQVYSTNELCMYEVVAIASYGIKPQRENIPDVYTTVFPYIDWIESIVWA